MNHRKEKERKALNIIFSFFSADEWLDCFDFWPITCEWASFTRTQMAHMVRYLRFVSQLWRNLWTGRIFWWRSLRQKGFTTAHVNISVSPMSFFGCFSWSRADESYHKWDMMINQSFLKMLPLMCTVTHSSVGPHASSAQVHMCWVRLANHHFFFFFLQKKPKIKNHQTQKTKAFFPSVVTTVIWP